MLRFQTCLLGALLFGLCVTYPMDAQEQSDGSTTPSRTLRPVIRGTQYAVSSMKPEATEAAVRILEGGRQRFRRGRRGSGRAGARQSASRTVSAPMRSCSSTTPARRRSTRSTPRGPPRRLATIDWYNKNNGGQIPNSDGLLSASLPGVVDAWYMHARPLGHDDLRAGARSPPSTSPRTGSRSASGLAARDRELARRSGIPDDDEGVFPGRQGAGAWRALPESRFGADAPQAGRSREGRGRQGPPRGAARGARSLLQGRHRPRRWRPSPRRTAASIATKISPATRRRSRRRSRRTIAAYEVYKNPSVVAGSRRAVHAEHSRRLRPQEMGHNSAEYIHASAEALSWLSPTARSSATPNFVQHPLRRSALQGIRARAPEADRSRQGIAGDPPREPPNDS